MAWRGQLGGFAAVLIGSSLLVGCAAERLDVVRSGTWPPAAGSGTFALAPAESEPGGLDIGTALSQRLQLTGLTPADHAPQYLIETELSDHASVVGAYDTAADRSRSQWVSAPHRGWSSRGMRTAELMVRVKDAHSGGEVYSARVTASHARRSPLPWLRMIDASLPARPPSPSKP